MSKPENTEKYTEKVKHLDRKHETRKVFRKVNCLITETNIMTKYITERVGRYEVGHEAALIKGFLVADTQRNPGPQKKAHREFSAEALIEFDEIFCFSSNDTTGKTFLSPLKVTFYSKFTEAGRKAPFSPKARTFLRFNPY